MKTKDGLSLSSVSGMTKSNVIISVFAGAVFLLSASSCVKVEADRDSVPAETISYQVVNCRLKAPASEDFSTKAGTNPFDDNKKFISSAYLLPEGLNWDDMDADGNLYRNSASVYIDGAEISKNGAVWRDASKSYYWPKSGSLTFFAYAPSYLPEASGTGNGVSISKAGVSYKGWEAKDDRLKTDFMAAVPAKDKSSNSFAYYSDGVPMLFKHKLAQIQFVAFVEKDDAGTDDDIYIESLVLTNIYRRGDFSQSNTDDGAWSNRSDAGEYVLFKPDSPVQLSTDELALMPSGLETMLMIPQNLSALAADDISVGVSRTTPEIVITYYQGTTSVSDKKTARATFESIRSYLWEMGTTIKYSITFGDTGYPILFDPSVNEWSDGDSPGLIVGGGVVDRS